MEKDADYSKHLQKTISSVGFKNFNTDIII